MPDAHRAAHARGDLAGGAAHGGERHGCGRGRCPGAAARGRRDRPVRGGGDVRVVRRDGAALRPVVLPGNPFHPNVDEVLRSAVEAGAAVGAAILTGMGQDGAAGALALSARGCR